MSTIDIKLADITKLQVDAVVNAANSRLAAGGGVCGAIFAAAGYEKLRAACDAIGGCPAGSAVITPGFGLSAKNIIHAVGPVWNGGDSGEEKALYDCYQAALRLAVENECRTVAFPLISSGIYGYPKREAWRVALKSVRDFQTENDIDVIFAVIDESAKEFGERLLGEASKPEVVRFHLIDEENGYLSNWYPGDFTIGGVKYWCAEQYLMAGKAKLFCDEAALEKIMASRDQAEIQAIGRNVTPFEPTVWDGMRQLIIHRALVAKFTQDKALGDRLKSTGKALIAECSRSDRVWGIGMSMDDPDAADIAKWRGRNLLGFALMAVREELYGE